MIQGHVAKEVPRYLVSDASVCCGPGRGRTLSAEAECLVSDASLRSDPQLRRPGASVGRMLRSHHSPLWPRPPLGWRT